MLLLFMAVASAFGDPRPEVAAESSSRPVPAETVGIASYYADKYHGNLTASGEVFDMNQMTAAHPNLPFGSIVRVTRLDTGKSVVVRINDRGPFVEGRVIDLSLAAARELAMVKKGILRVKLELVEQ